MALHADQITSLGRNAGSGCGEAELGWALVIYQGICQGFVREGIWDSSAQPRPLGMLLQDSRDVAAARPTKRFGGAGAAEGSFRVNIPPLLPSAEAEAK